MTLVEISKKEMKPSGLQGSFWQPSLDVTLYFSNIRFEECLKVSDCSHTVTVWMKTSEKL